VASIGSIGSAASLFSVGSCMSAGSVLSNQSRTSLLSHQSDGSVLASQTSRSGRPVAVTALLGLAAATYAGYRLRRWTDHDVSDPGVTL
jgi:hypothetical protein